MKKTFCSWEKTIMESVNQGTLGPDQRDHLSTCPACQEALRVRSFMRDLSVVPDRIEPDSTTIPDFESIWRGARSFRGYNRELEKRALKPLLIPQFLTLLAALIGMILFFSTDFDRVKDVVSDKLKIGFLFDLLAMVGKKMLAMVPYLIIPIIFVLFLGAAHFLYSLFGSKKISHSN